MNQLIQEVERLYTNRGTMLRDLCDLLKLSKSGLYSKLNGRTAFSIEEIVKVCRKYRLSFDHYIYHDKPEELPYSFMADTIRLGNDSGEQYVTNWFEHLATVDKIPNTEIYYLANEIPIFYYFRNPWLLGLKLYIWSKLSNEKNTEPISYYADHAKINVFSQHLSERYASRSTVEIWNPNMFNELLQQVRFFCDEISGQEDGLLKRLKRDLINVIDQMARSIESGLKLTNSPSDQVGKLKVYLNELRFSNEMILVQSEKQSVVYQQYDVPNYLRSYDPRICSHAKRYMDTILSQSTVITKSARQKGGNLIEHFRQEVEAKWPE